MRRRGSEKGELERGERNKERRLRERNNYGTNGEESGEGLGGRDEGREGSEHRRMGTLWLGGAEGLIAQNFTQITGADTGFPEGGDFTSTPPPLGHCLHDVIRPPEKLKNTPTFGHSQAPPPIRPPEN